MAYAHDQKSPPIPAASLQSATDAGKLADVSRSVKYSAMPAKVVAIDANGMVTPLGNGEATITARIRPWAKQIVRRLSPPVTMMAPPPTKVRAKVPTNSAMRVLGEASTPSAGWSRFEVIGDALEIVDDLWRDMKREGCTKDSTLGPCCTGSI